MILGKPDGMPATSVAGHGEISRIWNVLADAADVRSILIRGVGKGFCAGDTMDVVESMLQQEAARLRVMREARAIVQGMLDCDKPIVSTINGAAVGAGAALALLADISIAARGAKIIDGHTRFGVAAGDHAAGPRPGCLPGRGPLWGVNYTPAECLCVLGRSGRTAAVGTCVPRSGSLRY